MIDINPFSERIPTLSRAGDISLWGANAIEVLQEHAQHDPGHDEGHILRVLKMALWFGEDADLNILVPAVILHDLVNLPKNDPLRNKASFMSATKAIRELEKIIPFKSDAQRDGIFHAIEAHSWSANVLPLTIEAKALQDADRIEALGHIGIARLFAVGGSMGRTLFHPTDPIGRHRELDENTYTLDHYRVKLEKLHLTMQTPLGRKIAEHRTSKMISFIIGLTEEL